jgi:hypothetical protein
MMTLRKACAEQATRKQARSLMRKVLIAVLVLAILGAAGYF